MVWAEPWKVALGCVAFIMWWILAVFPAVPCLPIGRTAGSLLGAVLMVVFTIVSPTHAFESIDLPILALLFGTMVVSIYLERANMFKYLGSVLSWKSRGGRDLLCRVCLLSALCSAFFTNDTTCVVLTEFVLNMCKQQKLPPLPFLMALASSANIGSAGTAIGNPQNLVIAVQSGIGFGKFIAGVVPAVIVGIAANTILLLAFYWKPLSAPHTDIEQGAVMDDHVVSPTGQDTNDSNSKELSSISPSVVSSLPSIQDHPSGGLQDRRVSIPAINDSNSSEHNYLPAAAGVEIATGMVGVSARESISLHHKGKGILSRRVRTRMWTASVYLITAGFLAALLAGLNLSWSAVAAAVALMILDFTDAGPSLEKVSYSLLIFFSGMFIAVEGFNSTGAPGELWDAVEPQSRIDSVKGLTILALVVIVLSNVASNVPTVLLLGTRVAASAAATNPAAVTKAWLILAWVSTVAGNLTLLGSAANLIVSEQARTSSFGYNFSFWKHLPFGFPSTLIVCAVGLPLIRGG